MSVLLLVLLRRSFLRSASLLADVVLLTPNAPFTHGVNICSPWLSFLVAPVEQSRSLQYFPVQPYRFPVALVLPSPRSQERVHFEAI